MSEGEPGDQLAQDTQALGRRHLGVAASLGKAAEILAGLSAAVEASDRDHAVLPGIREDYAYLLRALEVLPAGVESLAASLQRASEDAREAAAVTLEAELLRAEAEKWREQQAAQAAAEAELAQTQARTAQMTQQITEMNAAILRGGAGVR